VEPTRAAPPRWQHPAIAVGVTLFVVVTVVAAILFGTSSTSGLAAPTPQPDGGAAPPASADDPSPLPPLQVEPPVGPAPVLRVELDRPSRAVFVDAVESYLRAWRTGDAGRLVELTWSNCEDSGDDLATELDLRFGSARGETALDRAIVVTPNLGVVELNDGSGESIGRLLFAMETDQWRSGLCSGDSDDLGKIIDLPEDVTDVAGLRFEDESMEAEVLQGRDLAYGVFDGATLTQANLLEADIEGASFVGADLAEAWAPDVDAGAAGAVFDDADLTRAVFFDARLTASSFAGADVRGADFTGAVLDDVDFRGANLDGAFIDQRAALAVADWTGAVCPDGETAQTGRGCLDHLNPYG
jgi:hypothetical protein